MNAIKQYYSDIPEMIKVPENFIHQKGEIIFIVEDINNNSPKKTLKNFFGVIPDFPERTSQGNYEERGIMKYILDTNVCIRLLNGTAKNILAKITEIVNSVRDSFFISFEKKC